MFIDQAEISIKAGDGGSGAVSFFTARYVPNGGPDGGDGGKGGDIIVEASNALSTLIDYKYVKKYKAESGIRGGSGRKAGKSGNDLIFKVPCGTIIKNQAGQIVADLVKDGTRKVLLKGGRGGQGNIHFATSRRQSPHFSQRGEITKEYKIILELKLLADVGIIGFPNVGKSTLLSVISDAKPKIANYHFTTLTPSLGVVKFQDYSFVAADIPGIIEGASEGAGLGHRFLRHIERTRLLVHVIDISEYEGRSASEDYKMVNNELSKFLPELANLPQVIALNKSDLLNDTQKTEKFKKECGVNQTHLISGATRQGIDNLLLDIVTKLKTIPKAEIEREAETGLELEEENTFSIEMLDDGYYFLSGRMIENLARNAVISDPDSLAYFQRALKERGINKALKDKGIKNGDFVRVLDTEFEWVD